MIKYVIHRRHIYYGICINLSTSASDLKAMNRVTMFYEIINKYYQDNWNIPILPNAQMLNSSTKLLGPLAKFTSLVCPIMGDWMQNK